MRLRTVMDFFVVVTEHLLNLNLSSYWELYSLYSHNMNV